MSQLFPPGHFYSPVVDQDEARRDAVRIWPTAPSSVLGINFNDDSHAHLLKCYMIPEVEKDFWSAYPDAAPPGTLSLSNGAFELMDMRAYHGLLLGIRPTRVVEVGSGYSTLMALDVKRRHMPKMRVTAIEPYPPDFLPRSAGLDALIVKRVQDVAMSEFEALGAGDILFIDSSHVAKTGSDVCHLIFEVLPRLRSGVFVHFHDIFLPYDYPRGWIEHGHNWNEQYVVRAMLTGSAAWEIKFGCAYARWKYPAEVRTMLRGRWHDGGSLYLRKR